MKYQFFKKNLNGTLEKDNEVQSVFFYYGSHKKENILRAKFKLKDTLYSIVEWNLFDSTTVLNGKNYLVFYGKEVSYIQNPQNTNYHAETIWLLKDSLGKYYPEYVSDKDDRKAQISYFKPLENDSISMKIINEYSFNQRVMQPFLSQPSDTIHLFTLTNDIEPRIKDAAKKNKDNIVWLIRGLAKASSMKFNHIPIESENFNKTYVTGKIRDFSATKNSVIIFYYSGHGFRFSNQNSTWPYIDLSDSDDDSNIEKESLEIKNDIFDKLDNINSRLLIVVGECCNRKIPLLEPQDNGIISSGPDKPKFNRNSAKKLISYSGKILIATCKPDESSYYDERNGGVFGHNFFENLNSEISDSHQGTVSWVNLFLGAINETSTQVKKLREKGKVKTEENPMYIFDIVDLNNGFSTNVDK